MASYPSPVPPAAAGPVNGSRAAVLLGKSLPPLPRANVSAGEIPRSGMAGSKQCTF